MYTDRVTVHPGHPMKFSDFLSKYGPWLTSLVGWAFLVALFVTGRSTVPPPPPPLLPMVTVPPDHTVTTTTDADGKPRTVMTPNPK